MELAQARKIDAVLVTELSRWGRSTQDLLETMGRLAGWKVSVVAMSGLAGLAGDLGIGKTTVTDIVRRYQKNP